jgi:geranylgeranyl diphosphate synthase type I
VAELWDELRVELNVGQYLDMLGTASRRFDRTSARRIARYKSGRYTIERPLHLGATLAGGRELVAPLSGYGAPLGEAFQLRDDVLGAFGDAARTGKPVGDDLREGKPTLLLAVAHERAEGAQRDLLAQVGRRDIADHLVADLQALLVSTGALDEVEAAITSLADQAVAALEALPIEDDACVALRDLAAFVVARDT